MKAVFLDKDGTLIEDVPYNVDVKQIRLSEGAIAGLRHLHAMNYQLYIVSNQSGVARGLFQEQELCSVEQYLTQLLGQAGVPIAGFYYCPHHPDGIVAQYAIACSCRKPAPGMLLQAAQDWNLDLPNSWMVGDILNDVEAGRRAGCRTILIDNGNETEWERSPLRMPHYTVANLAEAAQRIEESDRAQITPLQLKDVPADAPTDGLTDGLTMVTPTSIFDRWLDLRVLVIGDAILDSYRYGTVSRLCQEAPVPVVATGERKDVAGGAANTAVNGATLGADVSLLSVVGSDEEGDRLYGLLRQRGVDTRFLLTAPNRTTLNKQRIFGNDHLLLRLDQGTTEAIAPALEQHLICLLTQHYSHYDAVMVSDYGYGILTPGVIATLAQLQQQFPRPLVVDAKSLKNYSSVGATAVKPNYGEALRLLNLPFQDHNRAEQMMLWGDRLLALTGAKLVCLTLDREGTIGFTRNHPPYRTLTTPVTAQNTSGAGDTFVSALTLSLAAQVADETAMAIATKAAEIVVANPHCRCCQYEELKHKFREFLVQL